MKFYNREKEIFKLQNIQKASFNGAQMTVVLGRRRIGKTKLLLEAAQNDTFLYFFVPRKSEVLLCQDFLVEIKNKLQIPVLGEVNNFAALFEYLMVVSKTISFTLIIDEFQEFLNINPSVFSDMQRSWDLGKDDSKINLQLCGSVYSMMQRIFENSKEPLFGRANHYFKIHTFETGVLKEILKDYYPEYSSEDLLALYTFTGGVAKYIQILMDNGAFTLEKMIDFIVSEDSIFINEGKNILIEEFGKEYGIYFSILTAISKGENSRVKIEASIKKELGGYLTRLEREYSIISKSQPMFSKSETKNVRYVMEDNFLNFWFRYFYKYIHIIEIGAFSELKAILMRDYKTYSGFMLERYFKKRKIEEGGHTRVGSYWDRKGEVEIALIALNEISKTATIAEVKRKFENISLEKLRFNAALMINTTQHLSDYKINYECLSLDSL